MNELSKNLKSHNPLVTVLICAYNGEKYLNQTIESVLTQSYTNLEVLIVDDGSGDGTRQIIEGAKEKDRRIRAIFKQNGGLASARNVGFREAQGEWIAIIDHDDLCYPNRIEEQLNVSNQFKNANLVFCNTHYIDEKGKILGDHFSINKLSLPFPFIKQNEATNLLLKYGGFVDTESLFIKKKVFEKVGPFDESLYFSCDYDFFIRVGLVTNFVYTKKILAAWRIHDKQACQTSRRQELETAQVLKRSIFAAGTPLSLRVLLCAKIIKAMAKMFTYSWRRS